MRSVVAISAVVLLFGGCTAENRMEWVQAWMEQQRREVKPNFEPPAELPPSLPAPEPGLARLADPFAALPASRR